MRSLILAMGFSLLIADSVFAQNSSKDTFQLTGTVVDATNGSSLPGASVLILELKEGQSADPDGAFSFKAVPSGQYHLQARYVGYRDDTVVVSLNQDRRVTLQLTSVDVKLGEVQVTGTREHDYLTKSAQSVATLAPKELQKVLGQTLGETLRNIPGITVLQTGPSISKPVIRGLHSDRVLVLNAGIPQEGQQWGGEHAPEIDPFSPARIEVLKGAAGVAYGAGAIGGVISVEPRELRQTPGLDGQLTMNGFSNNRQGAGSIFLEGMHEALPDVGWRVQGSYRKAGNASTPSYVIGNTGFTEFNGSATIGYHSDHSGLEATYSYFATELGIYRGSHIGSISDLERAIAAGGPLTDYAFTYEIRPPKQVISHEFWSVKAHHAFPGFGNLEVLFGRQSNHRQEYDAYRFFNNIQQLPTRAAFDLTLTTYSVDVKLKHDPVEDFYGTVGLSGMRQGNVGVGSSYLIPNFRLYNGGIYVLEAWGHKNLTINVGGRFDYRWQEVFANPPHLLQGTVLTFSNVSAAIGGIYQFAASWSLSADLGTAFRPPSVNELYNYGVHHGTAEFEIGDPTLQNERSLSADLTLKHEDGPFHLELSAYNNSMRHFIFLFPNPQPVLTLRGVFPSFSYRQANAVLRGVDASVSYNLTPGYKLGVAFSLVRGDNLDTHEPLFQMPADRIRLLNSWSLPSLGLFQGPWAQLNGEIVRRQDRYPKNVDYTNPPPGYVTFDCALGTDLEIGAQLVGLSISVRNLLNAQYRDYLSRFRYYIDDPGRDIVLRVNIPFGATE